MKIAVIGMGRVGQEVDMFLKNLLELETVPCSEGYDPALLKGCDAAVICTPVGVIVDEANKAIAAGARAIFSCTEDWKTGFYLKKRFAECYFPIHVEPHCGLAPGWVGDMALELSREFDRVFQADLYAGALTKEKPDNDYNYAPTWNVDGLVKELTESCRVKMRGIIAMVPALEGYQTLNLAGQWFEAFYTAGGAEGIIDDTPHIPSIAYRSLRYSGHLDALMTHGIEGLRKLPLYTGPERVLAAVTMTGRRAGDHRTVTVVREFDSVAEATASHLAMRVRRWVEGVGSCSRQ